MESMQLHPAVARQSGLIFIQLLLAGHLHAQLQILIQHPSLINELCPVGICLLGVCVPEMSSFSRSLISSAGDGQ